MENNLDQLCFEHGIKIPLQEEDNNEKTIQKVLGILQEDGVFAFYIYLLSLEAKKKEKSISLSIQREIIRLFSNENVGLILHLKSKENIKKIKNQLKLNNYDENLQKKINKDIEDSETLFELKENISNEKLKEELYSLILESIKSLGDDINELLLAKSLIEKTLIYARYQAKSMGG